MTLWLIGAIVSGLGNGPEADVRPRACEVRSLFTSLNVLSVECDLNEIERRLDACTESETESVADLVAVADSFGTFPSVAKFRNVEELSPGRSCT